LERGAQGVCPLPDASGRVLNAAAQPYAGAGRVGAAAGAGAARATHLAAAGTLDGPQARDGDDGWPDGWGPGLHPRVGTLSSAGELCSSGAWCEPGSHHGSGRSARTGPGAWRHAATVKGGDAAGAASPGVQAGADALEERKACAAAEHDGATAGNGTVAGAQSGAGSGAGHVGGADGVELYRYSGSGGSCAGHDSRGRWATFGLHGCSGQVCSRSYSGGLADYADLGKLRTLNPKSSGASPGAGT